jgi:hypothetical protein
MSLRRETTASLDVRMEICWCGSRAAVDEYNIVLGGHKHCRSPMHHSNKARSTNKRRQHAIDRTRKKRRRRGRKHLRWSVLFCCIDFRPASFAVANWKRHHRPNVWL